MCLNLDLESSKRRISSYKVFQKMKDTFRTLSRDTEYLVQWLQKCSYSNKVIYFLLSSAILIPYLFVFFTKHSDNCT